jgi:hypothetical protein
MRQIFINNKTVLLFSFLFITLSLHAQTHFIKVWSGNGVDHMNINLVTAQLNGIDLVAGDEIGIFDGVLCVGSTVLTGPLSMSSILSVVVSRNDGSGNGYTAGHSITYKYYDQSSASEFESVMPTYNTNNPSWSSNGLFAIGATGFVSLSANVNTVPETITLSNKTISSQSIECFNAYQTITVAGGVTTVVFQTGSIVDVIAGNSIRFLPGFHAENGSNVHAVITSDSSFCVKNKSTIVEILSIEISSENGLFAEDKSADLLNKSVKIYPNPNNGQFFVEVSNFETRATVSIYNMLGSIVYESEISNEIDQKINLLGIKKGIYLVKVTDQKEQFTKKMIVRL